MAFVYHVLTVFKRPVFRTDREPPHHRIINGVARKMVRSKKTANRPEDLRFTKVSRNGLAWEIDRALVGFDTEFPEGGGLKKFDATPHYDFYAAMNLLLDFAIEQQKFSVEWTCGEVVSVGAKWTWDDEEGKWAYKLTIAIRRPSLDDDLCQEGFGPYSFTVLDFLLPEDVKSYLETIWDEAWLYRQGLKFQEKQGNIFEKPVAPKVETPIDDEAVEFADGDYDQNHDEAECPDGFCEVATESAIDDGAFESVVDAELADDGMIEAEDRELVAA
jgi:hypothetical protein